MTSCCFLHDWIIIWTNRFNATMCVFVSSGQFQSPWHGFLSSPPTYTSQGVKPVQPGPWLLRLPTSVFPGSQQFFCRLQTLYLTWVQLLRQDWVQASHWLPSVPPVVVGFSTVPWQWCSWWAWRLPLWSEMWSPLQFLCKRGSPEHHRDTWKVNVVLKPNIFFHGRNC